MDNFTELSVALVNKTFTLLTGTGLSKYLTDGNAPSWLELLTDCCKKIDKNSRLVNQLFNTDEDGNIITSKFELSICAQILEQEYTKSKSDLKNSVWEIIAQRINKKTINFSKLTILKNFLEAHPYINIVTTNYDTIISEYVVPDNSRVFIEDSTIPKINSGINIYHIHGCVTKPGSIILTLNDYYKFQNKLNYFSRKFFTLLQENTVAVVGYSLGDFNLNSILNEVRMSKKESFVKSDIFYISKNEVEDIYKQFYYYTYGIQVLDNCNIDLFISYLTSSYSRASNIINSITNLKKVLYDTYSYSDDFLRLNIALSQILIQASSLGIDHLNKQFLELLIEILNRKKGFTREQNAWVQYAHLADWLTTIGSLITIKDSIIEKSYCELALYSFSYCSKDLYKGYSWEAYNIWKRRWSELKIANQILLKDILIKEYSDSDTQKRRTIYEDN